MKLVTALKNIAIGVPFGIAALAVTPFFGAVGALTATGLAVGSTIGALAGVIDTYNDSMKK